MARPSDALLQALNPATPKSTPMTIEEVKKLKERAKRAIEAALDQFSNETGLHADVTDIRTQRGEVAGGFTSYRYEVDITGEI